MHYLFQRLVQFFIVFFIVTFGLMVLLRLGLDNPGDPARTMLGGQATPEQIAATNEKYHLNSNYLVQYWYWLKGMVTGDFGYSVQNNLAVTSLMKTRVMTTLLLGFYAMVIGVAIAVPVAVSQAYRRDRFFDKSASGFSFLLISFPVIVLAVFLKLIFIEHWDLFPRIGEKIYPWEDPGEHFRNFFLPTMTLAIPIAAVLTRILRNDMVLTLQSDFISLARAKGMSPRRILWRHALRNSLFSLITAIGFQLGALIGGAIVAEVFYDLDGMGSMLVVGILSSDLFTVQAVVAILVITVVFANLLIDLLYSVIDPRIRVREVPRMSVETISPMPAYPGEALVAQPALVKRKRGWPTPGAIVGMLWLGALTFSAVFADYLPFIRNYDQEVIVNGEVANRYALGPGWDAWFGTDSLGRDVFAKCIYGARTTLFIGVIATVIGLVFGGLTGIIAGYRRGRTDRVLGIFTDALLAMPAIVLAVIMIYKLDVIKEDQAWLSWVDRRWQITLTLGIVSIAPLSRIVRAQTLSLREREFVLAARSLGARTGRVLGREILPNLIPAMLTVAFTGLALLIAAEGGLAFLGLSVEIPTPTWGRLINANYDEMDRAWWATIFPCLMLLFTVLSFNMIGDWLARRFDIREATI